MSVGRLYAMLRDGTGAAAAEMALVAPLLLIIMMGSVELGNYFLSEHVLLKGVRDGARFAGRRGFANYAGCSGSSAAVPTTLSDDTKLIVRKGTLNSNDPDLLPNWASATFAVSMSCATAAGGTTLGGIYTGNVTGTAGMAPAVTVTASVPYRPVLASFGFTGVGFALNASEQAAVMGV